VLEVVLALVAVVGGDALVVRGRGDGERTASRRATAERGPSRS